MKYLIVYAHPNPASFNHAILETVVEELKRGGKDFTVRDLYKIDFKPVLRPEDFTAIQNGGVLSDVAQEQDYIRQADGLIFIFPVWWLSMPAILKGYIDRVFSINFAYGITSEGVTGLLKGKKTLLFSTTGTPKDDYEKMGAFQAMNMSMDRAIFQFSGIETAGHKYFSAVPYVSDEDRKKMLEEARFFLREKMM